MEEAEAEEGGGRKGGRREGRGRGRRPEKRRVGEQESVGRSTMERAGKEKAEELSCVVRIGWTSEDRKRGEERRGEERREGRGGEERRKVKNTTL
eukprot:745731-Hanusia_phi.AAC.1